ncbi:DJ-1 family glyoxalase III [Sulfurimonas sp.]|jgi:4-methyl-5(b-hydroxyethyl)-thiazole monophosphate biosynthesis|uniref:DJ-1 family glyoxalase III n=1 Tax=Sulfurimonas sp. TaxID=2022749 RepID=UPI0025EFA72F|nr:DJ-1 family glyoxalase III [Sulfurimonas sp.]MCK9474140.1 DJ-1/PfpI family protein [Sulfurimonas sp.]MDD3506781.1 DJ-1/PfpI family protein [Sulfurimonas sp.]
MSKVLVPLANGFEEIEAINIIDVLRRGDIEVLVASLDEKSVVEGAHKVRVLADMAISDVDVKTLDMIVLPGGWGGTVAMLDDVNIQRILKEMDKDGKNIGAICAAPLVLHQAGVLKHNYTCYPTIEEQIREDGFSEKEMVVEDGNVMTSRGPATAICFGLQIVKKLKGEKKSLEVKSALLADLCK